MSGPQGAFAAIGNFDGVHLGHLALIKRTQSLAAKYDAPTGVVLFDPHPRRYFRPEEPAFLITLPDERDALLRAGGVDQVFSLPFNDAMAALSPEAFVAEQLKGRLGLAGIAAGADFRFGARREGDAAALQQLGAQYGLGVEIIDLKAEPGEDKYSSSAVREALRDGDVKRAAALLGRPWRVSGVVLDGQKLGRQIGFATANMRLGEIIEPRRGVYAVRVDFDGARYNGVANFGRRPTVGETAPLLETHLFDFDGDLYGRRLQVEFVDFLRDERKFDGLDALKAQIAKDCEAARARLNLDTIGPKNA